MIDNDSFLEAIEEASHIDQYVPVIPEDDVVLMHFHNVLEGKRAIWEKGSEKVAKVLFQLWIDLWNDVKTSTSGFS